MKKIIISIFCIFSLLPFYASVGSPIKVKMQKDGSIYKIPCTVNGLRMKFVFDTGASNVSLSLTEANFMLENDYITKNDIIGMGKSTIANGSIVENTKINIREIEIGGIILKNVEAVVIHGFEAPLLLGQSAIEKLGKIQISGDELIIMETSNKLSDEEINDLSQQGDRYYKQDLYSAAKEKYQILFDEGELSDFGIYRLANCYYHLNDYRNAILYYKSIKDTSNLSLYWIYSSMGWSYFLLDDFPNALLYFEKGANEGKTNKELFDIFHYIAMVYEYQSDYNNSMEYYNRAINVKVHTLNIDVNEYIKRMFNNKIKDEESEEIIFKIMLCGYKINHTDSSLDLIVKFARKGNNSAIEYCKKNGLSELLSSKFNDLYK